MKHLNQLLLRESKVTVPKKKRGISEDKINIACAIDKHQSIHCVVADRGRAKSDTLIAIYKDYISEKSIVVSDSLRSYHKLMKVLGVKWEKIPSKKKEVDGYTLDKINGLHSCIKHFLYPYRGIAAKYLQNYVSLFIYLWENGEMVNSENTMNLFNQIIWNTKVTRNRSYNKENRNLLHHCVTC